MALDIVQIFRVQLNRALSEFPTLPHTLTTESGSVKVTFPKQLENGFDVTMQVSSDAITIETGCGWHDHACERNFTKEDIAHSLGLVRDLLSNRMRVREFRSNKSGYRWVLENFDGKEWRAEGSMGLIFWNYFGRRSEYCYQNDTLPARSIT